VVAGRVFLTDANALSWGDTFLHIVESNKLSEIVGEPTAGTTGSSTGFTVPGGYEIAWTGMKLLKYYGTQMHGIGVLPTVAASRTRAGVAADEDMKIPLGVVATDLAAGAPVFFRGAGDVLNPIRASCSYPGLFQPLLHEGRLLVDGAMSMEIPSPLLRAMGASHVISVHLPMQQAVGPGATNMFQVINRCFQIMQTHAEKEWRDNSDMVIVPDVTGMEWDAFGSADKLIQAGEIAALEAVPKIKAWLADAPAGVTAKSIVVSRSGSSPATA
jgi:predicted acylesterase/phospholipase RssA